MNNYIGKRLFSSWQIDDFEHPLGVGSFGAVYKLKPIGVNIAPTAVKIISIPKDAQEYAKKRSEEINQTEEFVQEQFCKAKDNLVKEIEMMLKVSGNTNCVNCMNYAIEEHEDCFGWDILIQMELLETLDAYFRDKGNIYDRDIIKLGMDMCSALEVCETNNMVHRDIKPSNIMVKRVGNGDTVNYKLGDFGVARVLTGGTLSIAGTPDYMAPELLRGEGDARVDIYSLGVVLYKLLNANRLPFEPDYPHEKTDADTERARQKRMTVSDTKPEPLYTVGTGLGKIIVKACEYDREKRYANAAEMRGELEQAYKTIEPALVFSQNQIGEWDYPESERTIKVIIRGSREKAEYDGKPHTAKGFTADTKGYRVNVKLRDGASAAVSAKKAGVYPMGLTKDSFEVSSAEPHLGIADVIVEDGCLEITKKPAKKGKIIAACAAAVLLIGALGFGIGKSGEKAQTPAAEETEAAAELSAAEDEDEVKLMLHLEPDEEATYSEVQHDTEIITERLKAIYADAEITTAEDLSSIDAALPLSSLGEYDDIDTVLKSVIVRPLTLSLIKYGTSSYYTSEDYILTRDDIADVKATNLQEAHASYGISMLYDDGYDIEKLEEDQSCLVITLSESGIAKAASLETEFVQTVQEQYGTDISEWSLCFASDEGVSYGSPFKYLTYALEDGASYVAIPTDWSGDSLAQSVAYSYTHDELNKGYSCTYELSPSELWEDTDEIEDVGAFQCNYDELPDDTVTFEFSASSYLDTDTSADVKYSIIVQRFKDMFDIIGEPYAVGSGGVDGHMIVICTTPTKLNYDVATLIAGYAPDFEIARGESLDTDIAVGMYRLEASSAEITQNESTGMYELVVTVSDAEELENVTSNIYRYTKDKNIYLRSTTAYLTEAKASLDGIIYDGKVTFTGIPFLALEEVPEEYEYLLELIKYKLEEDSRYQATYSIDSYSFSSDELSFGVQSETEKAIVELIKTNHPEADVWVDKDSYGTDIKIQLHKEIAPDFISDALDEVEAIFEEAQLDSYDYTVVISLIDETDDRLCRLVFSRDFDSDSEYLLCTGNCRGDWLNSYNEEFEEEAKSRRFFTKRGFAMYETVFAGGGYNGAAYLMW